MNNKANQTIQEEINNLYQTFAPYQIKPHMEACPCCVYDEDKGRVHSKTLQELSVSDLSKYAYKALSTWGNEDDFRCFLPRLFEIIIFEAVALTYPEILFGKLPYAKWRKWSLKEQTAIEDYFSALLNYQLDEVEPEDYTNIESYLCGIAIATENIAPYLRIWESKSSKLAEMHLQLFISQYQDKLDNNQLEKGFWGICPKQTELVTQWVSKQRVRKHIGEHE